MIKKILVTGGAGFIGTNFVSLCLKKTNLKILNIDLLTYASNKKKVKDFLQFKNYNFKKLDIRSKKIEKIIFDYKPDAIINFAAESHVDQSISKPTKFVNTNIIGTLNLLKSSYNYYKKNQNSFFKYIQISTDEVYGSLNFDDKSFKENSPFLPNSPYAASKAGADHLVRAFSKTYKMPILITHSSNNYGPYQNSEKLIPKTIINAIKLKKIPLYGDGLNIRDWIFVEDNCEALLKILRSKNTNKTYNIGGNQECSNKFIVNFICNYLNKNFPQKKRSININYSKLIEYVEYRKGHDRRYSVSIQKIKNELNWKPNYKIKNGLIKTIKWYINNLKKNNII